MKAIGVTQLLKRKFAAVVHGFSGNGKTDYCVKLAKYLASFTRVDYYSFEEGISKTVQQAFCRNRMEEVTGKVMLIEKCNFKEMCDRLARPRSKAFVIVCWERSGEPKSQYGRDIKYMVDIKVRVFRFKAYAASRYGGYEDYKIWERKPQRGEQLNITNQ